MGLKHLYAIFLCAITISTLSQALEAISILGVNLTIPTLSLPFVMHMLDIVGGTEGFEVEIKNAITKASSLRNNIPASLAELSVSRAIIAKICFIDGICWAVKMKEIKPHDRETEYGIMAMALVERYCPNIPISKYNGCYLGKVLCCFTEWKEGQTLEKAVFGSREYLRKGEIIRVPETIVTSLSEFVFNLTTCPIPRRELSWVQLDDLSFLGVSERNETELQEMNTASWVRRQFTTWHLLWQSESPSNKPFDGLDKLILLSWILRKFSDPNEPFVLHYWDLRMPNIIVNENNDIAIIDWDEVAAIPLKLSAISIGKFFSWSPTNLLDSRLVELFQKELHRIEQERPPPFKFSQMFLNSRENQFLADILRPRLGCTLGDLRWKYPDLFTEALRQSPEALNVAASEWESFTNKFFKSQGIPVPTRPQYVEIQEGLGLYGKSLLERKLRKFKRNMQKRLTKFLDQIKRKKPTNNDC